MRFVFHMMTNKVYFQIGLDMLFLKWYCGHFK